MSKQNQALALARFAWESRRWHVSIAAFLTVATALFAFYYCETPLLQNAGGKNVEAANEHLTANWTVLDRVVTVSTLAVGLAIWIGEVREEWERRLPRKLFAYFMHEGRVVAACLGANIGDARDARALGQQVGAQMFAEPEVNGAASEEQKKPSRRPNKQLRFDITGIDQKELRTEVTADSAFKPILIVFRFLDDEPIRDVKLAEGQALLWIPWQGKPEVVNRPDPRCQIPSQILDQTVIDAVVKQKTDGNSSTPVSVS